MTLDTPKLPVIDISSYLGNSNLSPEETAAARQSTAKALFSACRDIGFFYLRLPEHLVPLSEKILGETDAFFKLPQEVKESMSIVGPHGDGARGYQKVGENVTEGLADWHEGVDFYADSPFSKEEGDGKVLSGKNQFPPTELLPTFRQTYDTWISEMHVLGMAVMEAMADSLGLNEAEWADLKAKVENSFWVMRMIGYPQLPAGSLGKSCGAHKDYGCLTFLLADPTPSSLQVLLRPPPHINPNPGPKEGEWLSADPMPGTVVVNIGESWETWTNGLYKATLHQVIHKANNYRISIPFFFEPGFDSVIQPLDTALERLGVVGAKHYEPVVYGDFLQSKVGGNFIVGERKQDKY